MERERVKEKEDVFLMQSLRWPACTRRCVPDAIATPARVLAAPSLALATG